VNWTTRDYDRLERAITDRGRIQVMRRGSQLVLIPERLRTDFGEEVLSARHLGTGERMEIPLADIDAFEVVR
jgi:hypothetical protein